MSTPTLFKWRHFFPEIILLNVRWYCRYPLSYRNLEEMMTERGVEVDHSTINRWVLKYAPELDKRIRSHLQPTKERGFNKILQSGAKSHKVQAHVHIW